MNDITYEQYKRLNQADQEALELTVEQVEEFVRREIEDMDPSISAHPALREAMDKIHTIRALSQTKESKRSGLKGWEKSYFEILDGVAPDNKALQEAWNEYYVLKNLILGKNG